MKYTMFSMKSIICGSILSHLHGHRPKHRKHLKFITFNTKFIILNTKPIISNAKSIICTTHRPHNIVKVCVTLTPDLTQLVLCSDLIEREIIHFQ